MKIYIKQMLVLFLASLACLFYLEGNAAPPVKVTVTAAVPNSAVQGDTAEVAIDGTGFDAGSTARFIVTDTRDDTQIDVNEVTFDAATGKLNAKIKVKDAALPVEYDIEVTTSTGRRGKGTTLFRVREKAGEVDPCEPEFSPDFAFFRDTGNRKHPVTTIVLGQSTTGCEKSLVDFPIIDPSDRLRNLSFSSMEDQNGYFGRVVWTSNYVWRTNSVWKQDFNVSGTTVVPVGGPKEILKNMLLDDPLEGEHINSLDLSHDIRTLAYVYYHSYPDPDNQDVTFNSYSVRILSIDSCDDPGTGPCRMDDLDHAFELDNTFGTSSDMWIGLGVPSWGPLGNRIYIPKTYYDPVLGSFKALRYYDFEENWQALQWPPQVIYTDTIMTNIGRADPTNPVVGWFSRVRSGLVEGVEYLAIEDEYSQKTGGCEGVFIINAEDCLNSGLCSTDPEFAGAYPSWTKDENLIHAYDGWVPHGGCGLSSVGVWDSSDGSLTPLFNGYWPDAAGGIR